MDRIAEECRLKRKLQSNAEQNYMKPPKSPKIGPLVSTPTGPNSLQQNRNRTTRKNASTPTVYVAKLVLVRDAGCQGKDVNRKNGSNRTRRHRMKTSDEALMILRKMFISQRNFLRSW